MKLTKPQHHAIYKKDRSLLVSASAGSGKTFVLVKRILELVVSQKVSISNFLIVTFTNAAAAEMRERFAKALMAEAVNNTAERIFIAQQIQSLHQSQISTLHAFCKNVIKENFFHLALDPNFKVGTAQVLDLKVEEALDEVFEARYSRCDGVFENLLQVYASHKSDEKLRNYVKQIYNFSRAHPYPMQWLSNCVLRYDMQGVATLFKEILREVDKALTACLEQLDHAIGICMLSGGPMDYKEILLDDHVKLSHLQSVCQTGDYDRMRQAITILSFNRLKPIKKANKEAVDETLKQTVKSYRDQIKSRVAKLAKNYFARSTDDYSCDLLKTQPFIVGLIDLVKSFGESYERLKLDDNLLDFNDLEQYTIKLLGIPEVATYYQNKFQYIFVDEYQDSNRVQEEIIRLIARSNNQFLVGDVKQSIYRFRMAEPQLFLDKFISFKQRQDAERIDLNDNFRTHPDILNGINTVFDHLMTPQFGGVDYKSDARLSTILEHFKLQAMPTLSIAYRDEVESKGDLTKKNVESHLVAMRIKALLNTEIYDLKQQKKRKIVLSDIVILMRSIKGNAQLLSDDLARFGIASIVDEEDSYFDLVEVATVINLLTIIDNAHQDVPLLCVMRSQIGGFSDAELAQIRLKSEGSFYHALVAYCENGVHGALKVKANNFIGQLAQYRKNSHMPLSDYLWWLLQKTGYYYFVLGLEDGIKRKRHLDVLVEKAEQFEADRQSGIHHFVDYLEKMRLSKINYGGKAASPSAGQAVTVMSIHKSKGLEFNVVILAGIDKRFNTMELREKIVLHQTMGLTSKWQDTALQIERETLAYTWLKDVLKRETILEEARILYVALTRAIYKLEVVGAINNIESSLNDWSMPATSASLAEDNKYIDWLFKTILNGTSGLSLSQKSQIEQVSVGTWQLNFYPESQLINQQQQRVEKNITIFNDAIKGASPIELTVFNGHQYGLPSKLSVSMLKNLDEKAYRPQLSMLSDLFSEVTVATKRGNLYHKILENIRFDNQPIKVTIDKMIANKQLMPTDLSEISTSALDAFIKSDIYQRIVRANYTFKEKAFVYKKTFENGESSLVQGIVDLAFIEDNQLVIVDYKSDCVDTPRQLIDRYKNQLILYGEALSGVLKMPVKQKMIYSIHLKCWVEVG